MTTDARAPLLLSVALLLLCGADAHAGERARRLIEQAHRLTEKRFYDKARLRRAQWKRLGAEYAARAEALSDEEPVAARRLLNKMLGELETSHLVAVEGRVFQRSLRCELDDTRPPRLGLELVEVEGRLHAARLLEGGAAARAGVRAGDEVVHIDGVAPRRCPALHDLGHDPGLPGPSGYTLLVEEGQAVALDLRAAPTALSHSVTLRARPDNMIDASARSARIIPWRGRKLGYLHLWHFLHKRIIAIYRAALEDTFADLPIEMRAPKDLIPPMNITAIYSVDY